MTLLRSPFRSKSVLFGVLMLGAALLAVLPVEWARFPRGFLQPLSWFQRPLTRLAGAMAGPAEVPVQAGLSAEEGAALQRRVAELELLSAQQSDLLHSRESLLGEVTGLRQEFPDSSARIILGRVETDADADPLRNTLKIAPGALRGVRKGDWVAAGLRPGEQIGDLSGRELLLRRWLIGRVVEVDPHVSRVQLCTDPRFKSPVIAAKMTPEATWQPVGELMMLSGLGHGRMRVSSATANHYASGARALLVPPEPGLPARMVIGRVTAAHPMVESALHFALEVAPWAEGRPQTVYVISTTK